MRRILFFSVGFTILLYIFRVAYTGSWLFLFIPWNLFLAWLPLFFSGLMQRTGSRAGKIVWPALWLLFLPNAPYIITDLFHLEQRHGVPLYFDLMLLFSAAWNGLLMGLLSVKNVETELLKYFSIAKVKVMLLFIFFLSGFGIYLGRYDRYNSWHIVTQPFDLLSNMALYITQPLQHLHTWAVTVLFAVVFWMMYETLRQLQLISKQ
ncbi:MAG: DUF1361 domain-containing protein [Chitinophagaceae bacterium]|nr:DUF1361 domain-containing protein [Chitinophagaceae bacterium]